MTPHSDINEEGDGKVSEVGSQQHSLGASCVRKGETVLVGRWWIQGSPRRLAGALSGEV